jgi:toxin CcdB
MAKQFDVFANPLKDRAVYPLVVVLQSPFAELANTRIVAPAVRYQAGTRVGGVLMPKFVVDGQHYTLQTFQLTSLKRTDLKDWIANIADVRDEITTALYHLFHDNT